LGEKNEMIVGFAPISTDAVASAPIARRDIGFHAYDRLYSRFFGSFLELPRAMEVTVIGDGEGGLLKFERLTDEILDSVGAVEEGVFRVAVKVNEGHVVR
jgi:hypothetical protein